MEFVFIDNVVETYRVLTLVVLSKFIIFKLIENHWFGLIDIQLKIPKV